MTFDFSSAQWRKSSRSGEEVDSMCVEIAGLDAIVGVRDSKDPSGPILAFGRAEVHALLSDIKAGKLDL